MMYSHSRNTSNLLFSFQAGLVEKLVSGKLAKQQFVDQESAIMKKKEETIEKINSIVKSF